MKFKDYYKILGVERGASSEDIQKAFRTLARKYHPDVNKGKESEERFKELNEAYEVLKDPAKRERYDALGANWQAGQEFRPPPGWEQQFSSFGFGGGERGSSGAGFDFGNFSDFFEALFRPQQGSPFAGFSAGATHSQPQGRDYEDEVTLAFDDVVKGAEKLLTLATPEGEKKLRVRIPVGSSDGSRIRLSGQGIGGGDLYLRVKIAPHPRYRLDGSDIYVTVPVSPWEAALGGKVMVELPSGEIGLTIPPGSQSGTKLRLRGKGLKRSGQDSGDAFAELNIIVPKKLSKEEREAYEKLAEVSRTIKGHGKAAA